jgi:hypothetical protein
MMMILLRIRFEGTLKSHHRAIQWTNYGLIFGPAGFKSGSAILLAITVTFLAIWRSRSLFWRFGDHGHFFSGDHFLVDGDHRDPKKLKKSRTRRFTTS